MPMSPASLSPANSRARRAVRRHTSERASTASDADAQPIQVCSTQYQSRIRDGGTRDERPPDRDGSGANSQLEKRQLTSHENLQKADIMSSAKFESDPERNTHTAAFAERVRANQEKLTAELKSHYDFIVCGS